MQPLLILYGSQTGAAKSISESLHTEALSRGFTATIAPCNDYAKVGFESAPVVVIVCSTTGNGDPPANAEDFWRFIRKRTHAKTLLERMKYAVLGLGDTNYDKFCASAKGIVKRLGELSAQPFYAPDYADEAMGLDVTVEPWTKGLWPALTAVASGSITDGGSAESAAPAAAAAAAAAPPNLTITAPAAAASSAESTSSDATTGAAASSSAAASAAAAAAASGVAESEGEGSGTPVFSLSPMAMIRQMQAVEAERRHKKQGSVDEPTSRSRSGSASASAGGAAAVVEDGVGGAGGSAEAGQEVALHIALPSRADSATASTAAFAAAASAATVPSVSASSSSAAAEAAAAAIRHEALFEPPVLTPGVHPFTHLFPDLRIGVADVAPDCADAVPAAAVCATQKLFPKPPPCLLQVQVQVQPQSSVQAQAPLQAQEPSTCAPAADGAPLASSASAPGKCVEQPVTAHLAYARYLTAGGAASDRRVIHAEIDISGTALVGAWSVGDAVGLLAPNPDALAYGLCKRLSVAPYARLSITSASSSASASASATSPPVSPPPVPTGATGGSSAAASTTTAGFNLPQWLPGYPHPTAVDVLRWCVDVTSAPKKSLLRLLGDACGDGGSGQQDRDILYYLAGRGGRAAYTSFVEEQRLTLLDLLLLFPSSQPSLGHLLSALTPLSPRYYSIASSPLLHPTRLAIAFTVVEYECASTRSAAGHVSAGAQGGIIATTADDAPTPIAVTGDEHRRTAPHLSVQDLASAASAAAHNGHSSSSSGSTSSGSSAGDSTPGVLALCRGIRRRGIATTWLEGLCRPYLSAGRAPWQPPPQPSSSSPLSPGGNLTSSSSSNNLASPGGIASPPTDVPPLSLAFARSTGSISAAAHTHISAGSSGSGSGGGEALGLSLDGESPAVQTSGKAVPAPAPPPPAPLLTTALSATATAASTAWAGSVSASAAAAGAPALRIFLRPTRDFMPPAAPQTPIIMIGPGTGVAPFIGFLQHRQAKLHLSERAAVAVCSGWWRPGCALRSLREDRAFHAPLLLGPAYLFFGNRRQDLDYLYQQELASFLSAGALTSLWTAWSRPPPPATKAYVQARLQEQGALLAGLILQQGAHVYVCGDGAHMAKDVHATLLQILQQYGSKSALPDSPTLSSAASTTATATATGAGGGGAGLSEAEAAEILTHMAKKGRYVRDIWS